MSSVKQPILDAEGAETDVRELMQWRQYILGRVKSGGGLESFASGLLTPGLIQMYAGLVAPAGWLSCDGSAISRTTYSGLFAVIGTTFGVGDGSTTFNLPDMRSRSPVGIGQGTGLTLRSLADSGGEENHVLLTTELASHSHVQQENQDNGGGAFASRYMTQGNTDGDQTRTAINDGANLSTQTTGSGTAHNTMHPFLAINFIIKI